MRYRVKVKVEGFVYVTVYAVSEKHAAEKATESLQKLPKAVPTDQLWPNTFVAMKVEGDS